MTSINSINLSSRQWRLIPCLAASGAWQMAIDDWLFRQHEQGQHPPTLRFYTWSPPAISLGRLQRQWPDYWHDLTDQGQPLDLVRRPSGGRAVLHQGSLTYAVITALNPQQKSWASYTEICEFLIQGWQRLGIALDYGKAVRGYIHNPSCFNTATAADLVRADGSKLIGSAQRRGRTTLLQHGSMHLATDADLFQRVFGQVPPWQTSLCRPDQLDTWIPEIVAALTATASQCLGIELLSQPLLEEEWQAIAKKVADYQA